MTTELLKFKNPLKKEENWVNTEIKTHQLTYIGRVITAELGSALLTLTAMIETVFYTVFFIGIGVLSLCVSVACPDSSVHQFLKRSCIHLKHLSSSCGFTISWNLLNLLSDNFFLQK